ncbi:MAG: tRNA lysidine(34) synthetase TilS [Pyrinomonadaceae bacterium]
MSHFAKCLLEEWQRIGIPNSAQPVVAGVSGGADSMALLLAVHELISRGRLEIKPVVAHFDHGLRKTSKDEGAWVKSEAKRLGFPAVVGRKKLQSHGRNLEQAARDARYSFLERTATRFGAHYVLTAHTMDDQAETVLLRLMRGSSSSGLAGMESTRRLSQHSQVYLARPLLWARRKETEEYCQAQRVVFLQDEMNVDNRFSRVRIRQQLLPMMQSFNNRIVETLTRTAALLREDDAVLADKADELLDKATATENAGDQKTRPFSLNVNILSEESPAVRRRALRKWITDGRGNARRLEMTHLLAVERLLDGTKGGRIAELPGGSLIRRVRGRLQFERKKD